MRFDYYLGHEEIKKFLKGKWEKELDYKLEKRLFTFKVRQTN